MALYRRSPRQKKNLFLHEPKFVALPPRILETAGVPFVAGRHEVPTCWTGKSLDSSITKTIWRT
jgi:hypothetical protein